MKTSTLIGLYSLLIFGTGLVIVGLALHNGDIVLPYPHNHLWPIVYWACCWLLGLHAYQMWHNCNTFLAGLAVFLLCGFAGRVFVAIFTAALFVAGIG